MSLIKTASKIAAIATGLIATSAIAGTIVVRASGPSASMYPPGKSITTASVTLKPGDMLVLLDAKGTRTLSGAGVHSLASGSAAVAPSALGALIRSSGARQVRTGAVRGVGQGNVKAPNLWYVDASRGGTVCVADTGMTNVWRPNMTSAAAYSIWSDGKSVPLDFAAGQSVRAWPAELPLRAGARYKIAAPTGAPVEIVVQPVPLADSADAVGAALIAKGCSRQLDQLVEAGQASPAS
ncbi:MAG TPA: hypothetical protein VL405_05355 [Sphingomonas sp.]|nr:hypothetical protein [Sphingomonas sp.]